jgi:YD repeat-containing protein
MTNDTNGAIAQFTHDALGRRISKIDSKAAETTFYYYNNNWQVVCEYNEPGVSQGLFMYGNYIDEVIFMFSAGSPGALYYYVHDHLYNPVALTSLGGTVVERYEYDAYGQPTIWDENFTTTRETSNYGNPYYFQGKRLDLPDNGGLELVY